MNPRRWWRVRGERVAWAALLLVNVISHFTALGERAMSHDESMHAFYSYAFAQNGTYQHDPMLHGPLLFHVGALVFLLLGASDVTARVVPALAGVGVVAVLFAFRRYLGRWGALIAGVLMTLSPSLLFYGRYLRNDVYMALFALLWAYCAFRYRDTGRIRWLRATVLGMALSFSAKETCFITGATFGLYFAWAAIAPARQGCEGRRRRSGELALLMLTLVLPFGAALGHVALGWDPSDYETPRGLLRCGVLVAAAFALCFALALMGFRRRLRPGQGPPPLAMREWARLMLLFWAIALALFTTLFTNVPRGLASGIVGSLGYWLKQHGVGRGGQPWFYYLLLGTLYEFLPILLSAAGAAALARRRGTPRAPGSRRHRLDFVGFTLWWAAASWAFYSMAGEKMPWLMVHIALPMCLLGGWWLGRLLTRTDWAAAIRGRALGMLAAPTALLLLATPLLWLRPFQGRDLASVAASARWIVHVLAAGFLLAFVARRARVLGRELATRMLALGATLFLALLTARASLVLTFVNYDLATEYLVYAHGTPDIKRALGEIEELALRTGLGRGIEVAYDDDSAWPFTWYLRAHAGQRFYGSNPTPEAMRAPVVIVGSKNAAKVEPYVEREYVRRDYRLVWWPIEDYARLSWAGLWRNLSSHEERRRLWQIAFHRRYPGVELGRWPNRHEFKLYLRRDLVTRAWPLGLTALQSALADRVPPRIVPELQCHPVDVYTGPYGGVALKGPTGVAVAPDGARLIADTGNHRAVVLDRAGRFDIAFGGRCDLQKGPEGACIDADGPGPLPAGAGQFLEPWGVAAGSRGEIVVADTWNGRIQVFDRRGRFLQAWGRLAIGHTPPVPSDRLYGPRGLAFDRKEDRFWVTDTGNKRLLLFRLDGRLVGELGGGGTAPGRFDEPVGVAFAPDGSVYVADTWNRRIQRFGPSLQWLAEWPVPGWDGQGGQNKPYLAVDLSGYVYATDPENGRVLVFTPEGRLTVSLVGVGWRASPARPTGLAFDPAAQALLVADPANDRVWVLPSVGGASSRCGPAAGTP